MTTATQGSIVLPTYQSGAYYATHAHPGQDDRFKADAFLGLLHQFRAQRLPQLTSYADIGCGSGGVAEYIHAGLVHDGHAIDQAEAYDISPHVLSLVRTRVRFYMADYCETEAHHSLTTCFDVLEHVPDPAGFLRSVAQRCDFVGLHLPLDRSLVNCLFDRFHHRLNYPGHLSILDAPAALNLVTMAGVTPLDYCYTHGYGAPSGRLTWKQKAAYPARYAFAHLSPWLASRTVGGVSLMVLGATATGLKQLQPAA